VWHTLATSERDGHATIEHVERQVRLASPATTRIIIEAVDVNKTYDTGAVKVSALNDVSLHTSPHDRGSSAARVMYC
jgi:hypothetical protein